MLLNIGSRYRTYQYLLNILLVMNVFIRVGVTVPYFHIIYNAGKASSLEAASKSSKKRVHYQKFTRGKDISNYSTDDLGCILGR